MFRSWLIDTLTVEVVPSPIVACVMLVLSSFAGGWVFAYSGRWMYAIAADAVCYLWLWYGVRYLVEWVGMGIVKAILFLLP